jgi:flagella basal body P-ring formation protein FlgA
MSTLRSGVGLSKEDIKRLEAKGITTVTTLWARVGEIYPSGIQVVAKDTGISLERLTAFLEAEAVREAADNNSPVLVRHRWTIGLAVVAFLLFGPLIWAFFHRTTFVVANHDLKADQLLQREDLDETKLTLGTDYFTQTDDLLGTILVNNIAFGKPIHRTDVRRLQVVATTDLPSNTILSTNVVSRTWTPYQPGVALQIDQVLNRRTIHTIKKGEPINITSVTRLNKVDVVVINHPQGIPAFHVIDANDVTVTKGPEASPHYTQTTDVIGHYALQNIAAGVVLRPTNISATVVDSSFLNGRAIVSVVTKLGGLRATLTPPTIVSLIFNRSHGDSAPPDVQRIDDVMVLDIQQHDTEDVLVVNSFQYFTDFGHIAMRVC